MRNVQHELSILGEQAEGDIGISAGSIVWRRINGEDVGIALVGASGVEALGSSGGSVSDVEVPAGGILAAVLSASGGKGVREESN